MGDRRLSARAGDLRAKVREVSLCISPHKTALEGPSRWNATLQETTPPGQQPSVYPRLNEPELEASPPRQQKSDVWISHRGGPHIASESDTAPLIPDYRHKLPWKWSVAFRDPRASLLLTLLQCRLRRTRHRFSRRAQPRRRARMPASPPLWVPSPWVTSSRAPWAPRAWTRSSSLRMSLSYPYIPPSSTRI